MELRWIALSWVFFCQFLFVRHINNNKIGNAMSHLLTSTGAFQHSRLPGIQPAHSATLFPRPVHLGWFITAAVEQGRSRAVVFSSLVLLSSCLSCSARAAPSLLPRAGGGALTTSGHAAHVTHDVARAARGESRGVLSEFAARVCVPGVLCFAALFSPLRARRSLAPLLASTEAPGPRAGVRRTRRDARRASRAASPRAVRFPLSQFAVRAPGVFLGFALLPCASFRVPPCLFSRAGGRRLAKRARAMRVQPAHYAPYVPGGLCLRWRRIGAGKRVELGGKKTCGVEPKRVELGRNA